MAGNGVDRALADPRLLDGAADWDAIHVSVAAHLTTAGLAFPLSGGARTMLAGWDPDATWWLNDVLSLTSPPEVWRRMNRDPFGWIQGQ